MELSRIQQFVRINNKYAFLLPEIPVMYPGTHTYISFWKEQKKRCVEGFWGDDNIIQDGSNWRWMPGNLYFYVNFGTITIEALGPDFGKRKRPLLRDVEWEFFYNYEECKGFAGFVDDDEYTCYKGPMPDESSELYLHIHNSKGELKKYVPVRDYLRKTHSNPLGRPYYGNRVKNLFLLGSRGFGKSYSVGVGVILHTFLFDGMDRYTEEMVKNPPKRTIMVGAAVSDKSSDILRKTKDALDNLPGGMKVGTKYYMPPLSKKYKGSLDHNNANEMFRHEYEVKTGGSKIIKGTKTGIRHSVYTTKNPEAAVGGRFYVSIIEEVGLLSNCLAVHGANEACQRIDGKKVGVSIYIGTGGNIEKIREPETIFRDPDFYDCLSFEDTYENLGKIGWFMPYHYASNEWKDEHGNTDLELAHKHILKERKERSNGKGSRESLDYYVMSYPIVPSEMFLSKQGSFFPVSELRNRKKLLRKDDMYKYIAKPVHLFFDSTTPEGASYTVDTEGVLNPLLGDTKITDKTDLTGAPVIYEAPIKIDGKVPPNMYVFGCDPFEKDIIPDKNPSLGAFYVLKTYEYSPQGYGYAQIVAEYVGRPNGGNIEFARTIDKLMRIYGASQGSLLIENNKGHALIDYFKKNSSMTHVLASKPVGLMDNKPAYYMPSKSVEYGMSTTNQHTKLKLLSMVDQFLLEERREDEEGNVIRNLDLLPSISLIEELITFNREDNFDRVMALAMAVAQLRNLQNEIEKDWKEIKTKRLSLLSENNNLFYG